MKSVLHSILGEEPSIILQKREKLKESLQGVKLIFVFSGSKMQLNLNLTKKLTWLEYYKK